MRSAHEPSVLRPQASCQPELPEKGETGRKAQSSARKKFTRPINLRQVLCLSRCSAKKEGAQVARFRSACSGSLLTVRSEQFSPIVRTEFFLLYKTRIRKLIRLPWGVNEIIMNYVFEYQGLCECLGIEIIISPPSSS